MSSADSANTDTTCFISGDRERSAPNHHNVSYENKAMLIRVLLSLCWYTSLLQDVG